MSEFTPENPAPEAKTLAELNIHLAYMRDKMTNNNLERMSDMKEIKGTLKAILDAQVTRQEFSLLSETVKDNTSNIKLLLEFKNTLNGKLWGISVSAGLIVSVLNFIFSVIIP